MAGLGETFEDEEADDGADMDGGIFGEGQSVFNHQPGSSYNPQITRAQEQQSEDMPGSAPADTVELVFVQDSQGNVQCARAVNGNIAEPFRAPTPEEAKLAPQARWKAVPQPQAAPQAQVTQPRGPTMAAPRAMGVLPVFGNHGPFGNVPGVAPAVQAPPQPQGISIGKLVGWAAVLAGVSYGGWKVYQAWQDHSADAEDDAAEDEIEDAEDTDDEVEV